MLLQNITSYTEFYTKSNNDAIMIAKGNAVSCPWAKITPYSSTGWKLTDGEGTLQEGSRGLGGHETVMCLSGKGHQQLSGL